MTPEEMMAAIRLVVERNEDMGLEDDEAIDEIISIVRDRD